MICESCHGTGKLTGKIGAVDHVYPNLPCPNCVGGAAYCCDGADYDAEADAIGCYNFAVRTIGERVKAGMPLPAFFRPGGKE